MPSHGTAALTHQNAPPPPHPNPLFCMLPVADKQEDPHQQQQQQQQCKAGSGHGQQHQQQQQQHGSTTCCGLLQQAEGQDSVQVMHKPTLFRTIATTRSPSSCSMHANRLSHCCTPHHRKRHHAAWVSLIQMLDIHRQALKGCNPPPCGSRTPCWLCGHNYQQVAP